MSNGGATEVVNPKKSRTTEFDSNGEDEFDSLLKPINQRQLVVTTSTSQARSWKIEGLYTKFDENDITLQQAGQWNESILGRQGIG
jgi:transcriptional regulator of acetoin/glycerol metabolism